VSEDLYHTTDADGISEINPDKLRLRELLEEAYAQHPVKLPMDADFSDVSLIHDTSGWSLSVFPSGVLVWENLDESEATARCMRQVSLDRALALWLALAEGNIALIESAPWENLPN